jgi:hypothetical protein
MRKLIALTLILATSACATQRYGRATNVSEIEKKEFDGECTSLCATYAYALVWK